MAPESIVAPTAVFDPASPSQLPAGDVAAAGFISRVSSLPMVNSALQQAKQLYDTSKSKYQLIDQIEASVKTRVVPQFQPIVKTLHAYDAQLAQIDMYACTGLDLLETQLPIIKQPTDKVIESTRALVDERIVVPVRNATNSVTSSISRSLEDGKHVVEEHLKSAYVNDMFVFTESLADRLLGPDDAPRADAPTDVTPLERAQHLGQSVSTRIGKHAAAHLPAHFSTMSVNLPTAADLTNLIVIADLVKYSNQKLAEQRAWLDRAIAESQKLALDQRFASVASAVMAQPRAWLEQTQKHLEDDRQRFVASYGTVAQILVNNLATTAAGLSTLLPESVRAQSARLRLLLEEQLSQLEHLQRARDSVFFHKLSEAAGTGQKYLDVVAAQLTHLYASGKAAYKATASNGHSDLAADSGHGTPMVTETTEIVDEVIAPELVDAE